MVLVNVLFAELLEHNPGTATEAKLRAKLELNPDGSIKSWNLRSCGLRALPELFGAVCTTRKLRLGGNQLSSLPDSFGSITVGANLGLTDNQLQDRDIPTAFPNVCGRVYK